MENVQWSVCLVHGDGISNGSGSGGGGIGGAKEHVNSGVIGRLEGF